MAASLQGVCKQNWALFYFITFCYRKFLTQKKVEYYIEGSYIFQDKSIRRVALFYLTYLTAGFSYLPASGSAPQASKERFSCLLSELHSVGECIQLGRQQNYRTHWCISVFHEWITLCSLCTHVGPLEVLHLNSLEVSQRSE